MDVNSVMESLLHRTGSNGEFVTSWGGIDGTRPSEFSWLESVDGDSMGNVYVADMKNHRVQKFDSNANFITMWGSKGEGDGQFNNPAGVAIDV